jgi:hypothetical protein
VIGTKYLKNLNPFTLRMLQYEAIGEDKARPGQALNVAGGSGSRISRKSTHDGGKVVCRTHRQRLAPRK